MSSEKKFEIIETNKKVGAKRYMLVKVGTDQLPASDHTFEEARESLKDIIEATKEDFEWVFVPHYLALEALVFDHLS